MGDVVLLVPVVRSLVQTHPDVEVTVVTRPKFASFFTDIERVIPFPADVDHTYNGVLGMRDLFKVLLKRSSYDVVIDVHDHIRTMVLRTLFRVFATKVIVFDKGRREKKMRTRLKDKVTTPLPHTVERYRLAFEKAGFNFEIQSPPYLPVSETIRQETSQWLDSKALKKEGGEKWIGIAPFAMHISKIWPLENYVDVIAKLTDEGNIKVFLFGGGAKEINVFSSWVEKFPSQCVMVAGELKLKHELALMQKLDAMLCVDSSNMHLAALVGVPVVSVWGGTHTDVGFGPFGGGPKKIIEISREELPCRPCSVYGRENCFRGDFACLNRITPSTVANEVMDTLNQPLKNI